MLTMRITGGRYCGRKVIIPQGELEIRPAMDRMRESLFAILGPLDGISFCDLFSGSGCVGLEAASRGAKLVQGKNGPFVSMPQRQTRDGYQEVVFPVTKEMRELVNSMGLSAYQLAMKDMAQKMEQNQPQQAAPDAPTMSM